MRGDLSYIMFVMIIKNYLFYKIKFNVNCRIPINIKRLIGVCTYIPLSFPRGVDCILSRSFDRPTPVQSLTPYHEL